MTAEFSSNRQTRKARFRANLYKNSLRRPRKRRARYDKGSCGHRSGAENRAFRRSDSHKSFGRRFIKQVTAARRSKGRPVPPLFARNSGTLPPRPWRKPFPRPILSRAAFPPSKKSASITHAARSHAAETTMRGQGRYFSLPRVLSLQTPFSVPMRTAIG